MSLEDPFKNRLPMFGPLDIRNSTHFLREAKVFFNQVFHVPFPYKVKLDDFDLLYSVRRGSFGKTMIVRDNYDGSYYLMRALKKKYQVKEEEIKNTLNYKRILQSLNCPFCERLEKIAIDNSYVYLFLPFMNNGDIFSHLKTQGRFDEPLTRFYASQVVLGLEYLHFLNIIHRDIKPENLTIDHLGYLKITDFSLSKFTATRTYSFCGTLDYIAPEVIMCSGYGISVDWWSLGVLLYEMASGTLPFSEEDEENVLQILNKMLKGKLTMPRIFSEGLQDIIKRLLQVDVTRRFGNLRSGSEDVKFHRWFRHMEWFDLLNRQMIPPWTPSYTGKFVNKAYFPNIRRRHRIRTKPYDKYKGLFDDF